MQPTDGELQAALVVHNALGIEVASVSSVFATADGRTSVDNTIGEVITAYPLLRLPAGTPPGNYTVSLRVFSSGASSGYDHIVEGRTRRERRSAGNMDGHPWRRLAGN